MNSLKLIALTKAHTEAQQDLNRLSSPDGRRARIAELEEEGKSPTRARDQLVTEWVDSIIVEQDTRGALVRYKVEHDLVEVSL
jgi:hypothetical protein